MILNNQSVKHADDREADQSAPGGPDPGGERCDHVDDGGKPQRQCEYIVPTNGQKFILRHPTLPFWFDHFQAYQTVKTLNTNPTTIKNWS